MNEEEEETNNQKVYERNPPKFQHFIADFFHQDPKLEWHTIL